MGKIRILPDILVSKIAAGEVVERPASVVKELLENSVDAGAGRISVYLKSGGKRLIRVVDNGSGMSRDDALMSLERHATSKINNVEDLFSLNTLGFRGEAIPSIASVSRFTLLSKTKESETGTEIYIDGGVIKSVKEKGLPEGTSVEVKNLFFNTRPRLKFLRTPETELLRINEVIQREAISRPNISFEVFSDDKELYHYAAKESQKERILQVIPNSELFRVYFQSSGITISGYLSSPFENRTSMQKLYTYVNGRPVRDRFINRTVITAYGNLIEKGKYPQGVLFISVNPEDVDVNVHPTKSEVKFQNQYYVGESIKNAIKEMLGDAPWISGYRERSEHALKKFYNNQREEPQLKSTVHVSGEFAFSSNLPDESVGSTFERSFNSYSPHQRQAGPDLKPGLREDTGNIYKARYYSDLNFIGQIGKLYLLCETGSGLLVVDQHAAHERVNFEKTKKAYLENRQVPSQHLLMAEIIELSAHDLGICDQHSSEISKLGFDFEVFGKSTIRVSSVPAFLLNANYKEIFLNLLNDIDSMGEGKSIKDSLDLVCATIACHSSVRANQRLSSDEVRYLFEDLDKCEFPHACPHGRPVVVEISYNALEKMFRRT